MKFFADRQEKNNHLRSAFLCLYRLLRLANFTLPADSSLYPLASSDEWVSARQLKCQLTPLVARYSARLYLRRLAVKSVKPHHVPLAFRGSDGRFAVLARLNQNQGLVQYVDNPSPTLLSRAQLEKNWGGVCLLCPPRGFNVRWLMSAFLQYRGLFKQVLLLSVGLQLLGLVSPLFFQVIMDKVLFHQVSATLDVLVIVLIVVSVFEGVMRCLRDYVFHHSLARVDIRLGAALVEHVLNLPLAYFKAFQVGHWVARISALDVLREFLSSAALILTVDIVCSILLFIIMGHISPLLTVISLAVIPLLLFLSWMSTAPLKQQTDIVCQQAAEKNVLLTETVSCIETLKSLAVAPRFEHRWENLVGRFAYRGFLSQQLQLFISYVAQLLPKVGQVLLVWIGAEQVIAVQLTLGQLIACSLLSQRAMEPMTKLVDLWQQGIRAKIASEQLEPILRQPTEAGQSEDKAIVKGDIQLVQVTFRYPQAPRPLFNRLTLHVRGGEHLGVVGLSGSGKSTLARLLQRLYRMESGQIFIDGQTLPSFSPEKLRRQVAVVTQECFLFTGTLRDNIALAQPTTPLSRIIEVAQWVGAHAFILALPLGYDTVLSEGGASLSGGERQRIALARGIITSPQILILDEATSALDNATQQHIQRNMPYITAGRTVITIAHRLSTLRHCDRIAVLHQGQVSACAPHAELMAEGGLYAQLWQKQAGGPA